MTDARGLVLLLAAVATPMPAGQNLPGSDSVALDTLFWAKAAVVTALALGLPALIFGVVDFAINMRQFSRPKLSVSLRGECRDVDPLGWKTDDGGVMCDLPLQLNNDGKRVANGCVVSLWFVLSEIELQDPLRGWRPGGKGTASALNIRASDWRRVECSVEVPVYVDHPFPLLPVRFYSRIGQRNHVILWQVSHEWGKTPGAPEPISFEIFRSSLDRERKPPRND